MMTRAWRPATTARAVGHEIKGAARLADGFPSLLRYSGDILLYRLMRVRRLRTVDSERTVRLKSGIALVYRLNRGDIQGIREVWIDEAYRLPFRLDPRVVIDLGANIGLTSLFFATRYGSSTIVAVEPDPANARLTRLNFARNGLIAEVVEGAAAPEDGVGYFESHPESNLGHIGPSGRPVPLVSMSSLLDRTPGGVADLVKMDIEGGEGALLDGDTSWLDRVGSLIVEFHPTLVDYPKLVSQLEVAGFQYVPANSAWPGSMDSFFRPEWPSRHEVD